MSPRAFVGDDEGERGGRTTVRAHCVVAVGTTEKKIICRVQKSQRGEARVERTTSREGRTTNWRTRLSLLTRLVWLTRAWTKT